MNKKTYTAPEAEIEKFSIHCDDLLSGLEAGNNNGDIGNSDDNIF